MCPLRYVILGVSVLLALIGFYVQHTQSKKLIVDDAKAMLSSEGGQLAAEGSDDEEEEEIASDVKKIAHLRPEVHGGKSD